MTSSILPGTVLNGRYHLDDLLDDIAGARSYRATDQNLGRSVAIYLVAEEDPRAEQMLIAARDSATVSDPHVLRVLDAESRDGCAFVVNEWGSGRSLDILVSGQTLSPERAAWLTRECAAGLALAHEAGVAHGRLAPENVMVTESRTVRMIGFAIDATLQRVMLRSGNYPGCTPVQADLYDLGGLLYAGLVGRWPGASGSQVRPAPRGRGGALSPRRVRAGVPAQLNALCRRILTASPDQQVPASEIAELLTDYLAETLEPGVVLPEETPLPEIVPSSPAATPRSSEPAASEHDEPAEPEPDSVGEDTELVVLPAVDPTPPQVEANETDDTDDTDDVVHDDEPWTEETHEVGDLPGEPTVAMEFPQADDDEDDQDDQDDQDKDDETGALSADELAQLDDTWYEPDATPQPPPPDLEPVPERPLFAPEGVTRRPRGDAHRSSTEGWGSEVAARGETSTGSTGSTDALDDSGKSFALWQDTEGPLATQTAEPVWPIGEDPEKAHPGDDWEERTRRHWLRVPLAILAIAVVVAGVVLYASGRMRPQFGGDSGTGDAGTDGQTASPKPGQTVRVRSVDDLDPYGSPPTENPDQVRNVIDGKPGTAWETVVYRGRPDLGGLKPGVGVVLDLGSVQRVSSVEVRLVGAPTDIRLLAARAATPRRPSGIEGLTQVATQDAAGRRLVLRAASSLRTRYLVLWLTKLPAVDGGYQGGIAEATVRS